MYASFKKLEKQKPEKKAPTFVEKVGTTMKVVAAQTKAIAGDLEMNICFIFHF